MPLADTDDDDLFDVPNLTMVPVNTISNSGSTMSGKEKVTAAPTITVDKHETIGGTRTADTSPTSTLSSTSYDTQGQTTFLTTPLNYVTEATTNYDEEKIDYQNEVVKNHVDSETVSATTNAPTASCTGNAAAVENDNAPPHQSSTDIPNSTAGNRNAVQSVQEKGMDATPININTGTSSTSNLYSILLPGVGRVLAVANSQQSCDVDTLYDQETKPCDVDAYVDSTDIDDDDSTEHDDQDNNSNVRMYISPNKLTSKNGLDRYDYGEDDNDNNRGNQLISSSTHGTADEFDIEANRASIVSIIRRVNESSLFSSSLTAPLDPECDPFAKRTGKTLSWRNINMTLVRFFSI
jgi:hypothetical protein